MGYSDSRENFFWSFCQNVRDKPSGETDVMYFKLFQCQSKSTNQLMVLGILMDSQTKIC